MWFVGLFIGLLLGSIFGGRYGMLWGGVLGAVAGALISHFRGQARQPEIEARLAALEAAVRELRQKLSPEPRTPATAIAVPPELAAAPPVPEVTPAIRQPVPEAVSPVLPRASASEPVYAEPVSSQPVEPSPLDRAWTWLTGGNALVRVGVVVLFFGVAFLLKYAYEHTHVPIEVRLIGVALGAAVMLAIGWRLRSRKPVYALAMQGGGVGLLYLTVFGAFRLFNLIPGEAAFFVLVAVAVLSTPVPFRQFVNEPPVLVPAQFPWSWLPTFLVQAALFGHLLVFRALRRQAG